MGNTSSSTRMTTATGHNSGGGVSAAAGFIAFAAWMMILIGSFHVILGIGGVTSDTVYAKTPDYFLALDSTTWGWIHIVLGVVAVVAGAALFSGAVWARTVGVLMAAVSAVGTFAFLPNAPIWGIAVLAADVMVIWALTAHGRAWVEE